MKICILCNEEKPLEEFRDKRNKCKCCELIGYDEHRKTLSGCLHCLLNNAKHNSKNRIKNGNEISGICTITFDGIEKLWKEQNGICYYSNIPMNFNKNIWKVSLERLNPNIGYITNNIALCCIEFNCSSQWSKEKIKEMLNILSQNITVNNIKFDLDEKKVKCNKIKETIIDGIKHYNCNKCNTIKKITDFNKAIHNGCKECGKLKSKERRKIPRVHLQNLISSAIQRTTIRGKRTDDNYDNTFNINFDILVSQFNKQKGLCAYSGIPIKFGSYKENNWTCSLERIDAFKGYSEDNICLICYEFNMSDKTILYKDKTLGNSGWTSEKFKIFLEYVNKLYT